MTEDSLNEMLASWENLQLTLLYIADHPDDFRLLMKLALDDSTPNSWRACWLVNKIHEKKPELFTPYLCPVIDFVIATDNRSKKRELLRLITMYPVPTEKRGRLFDFCIRQFTSAAEPVAVRTHAMQILFNISETEPEIKPELIQIIEHEMEYHSTAGIHSRGKKLLHKLYRQVRKSVR